MRLAGLAEVFFPHACVSCGRVVEGSAFFCGDCEVQVEPLEPPYCRICAEPGDHRLGLCDRCESAAPVFNRSFAPFVHHGPIARAIHQLKYEDHPELSPPLAALLAGGAKSYLSQAPKLICAVPLHRARLFDRKYDQAQLLARSLAQATERTYLPGALSRTRATARQVGLSEEDRESNVAGAFTASKAVRNLKLLLLDDVFTTGATAAAAAKALRLAGAAEVWVVSLARAVNQL